MENVKKSPTIAWVPEAMVNMGCSKSVRLGPYLSYPATHGQNEVNVSQEYANFITLMSYVVYSRGGLRHAERTLPLCKPEPHLDASKLLHLGS